MKEIRIKALEMLAFNERHRWVSLSSFMRKKLSLFSVESTFLIAFLSILLGISCASFFDPTLVVSLLVFSFAALFMIMLFRGWGYAVISGIFCIVFSIKFFGDSVFSILWIVGLESVFLISWGVFWLAGTMLTEAENKKTLQLEVLTRELDEKLGTYQQQLQEKAEENTLLISRSQSLEKELQECKELLKEAYKKQEHLSIDLQVLSDQKNSWLEEYAVLHNEYVHRVVGDENIVFPWMGEQEILGRDQESKVQILQDKGLMLLQEELAKEKQQHKLYAERCQELSVSLQQVESLQGRVLELQKLLEQKEKELGQLRLAMQETEATKSVVSEVVTFPEERRYQCMYKQLREQFSEKDKTLSAARKELFAVKEQYLTLRREQQLAVDSFEDIVLVHQLLFQIELLEEEVIHLEELVSHSLTL